MFIYQNKIQKPYENTLVSTLIEDTQPHVTVLKDIKARFLGPKIIIEDAWAQVIKFFVDHPNHEVQVRGYFHPELGAKFHAFPQKYPCGMHTSELDDHPNFKEDRQTVFQEGYQLFMSVHHHCHAPAFQSGVDSKDEDPYPGLHITLGHMNKPQLDWHHRFSFAGAYKEVDLRDWYTSTKYPFLDKLPKKHHTNILLELLCDASNQKDYPSRWKENLIKTSITPMGINGKKSFPKLWGDYESSEYFPHSDDDADIDDLKKQPELNDFEPCWASVYSQKALIDSLPCYVSKRANEYGFKTSKEMEDYADEHAYEIVYLDEITNLVSLGILGELDDDVFESTFVLVDPNEYGIVLDALEEHYEESTN